MYVLSIFLLLGGLGMLLYGMKMMTDGLTKAAGGKMQKALAALTTNRFTGLGTGIGITAVIQSSSAITVMVVGFVNAGLMSLLQATGVIMGANIGTTITAQIIAFNLTDFAPVIIFAGMVMTVFIKKAAIVKAGEIVLALGILFFGLNIIMQAMKPLQTNEGFQNFLINFKSPVQGIIAGMLFTAVIQSSSASVGILQTLAVMGLVSLDRALYIVLGQNIGTCITAILAAIGTCANSKRAACIHLMFNILGTVFFLMLLTLFPEFPGWIETISGNSVSRQIANFHTISNIAITVLLFPFAKQLAWLATSIIPEKTRKMV